MKVETKSGFQWNVDKNVMDDAEILDLLVELDEGEYGSFSKLVVKILGKDGKKALYDHLRTEDGRVPYDALDKEIQEIILSLDSKKK